MKKIIINFIILFLLFFANISCAKTVAKYNLILFYADWNVYSTQAISELSKASASSKKIAFEKINVDDKKAFVRIKQLGVMPVNSIPYYFLIDKNKKIIYGSSYNNETSDEILIILNKKISDY